MWHSVGNWALVIAKYAFSHRAEIVGEIQGVQTLVAKVKASK